MRSPSGFHIIKLLEKRGGENQRQVTQTRASQIVLRASEALTDDEARARLEQLKQRAEDGDSFADLARSHSDDPASAAAGGDLGWINPGELAPGFDESIQGLQVGEISAPFKTAFGWHIV